MPCGCRCCTGSSCRSGRGASARKYRKIWTRSGSPLLDLSERLRAELTTTLAQRMLAPLSVELGMLYSNPRVRAGARAAARRRRAAHSGAAAVSAVLRRHHRRGVRPGQRGAAPLALAAGAALHRRVSRSSRLHRGAARERDRSTGKRTARTAHLLMSFHGIPERSFHQGDPYFCKCQKTARLLADELMLRDAEWSVSFQSRFGPAGWLQPYTSTVLGGHAGARRARSHGGVPGLRGRLPRDARGDRRSRTARFSCMPAASSIEYVPALNAAAEHARFLADLIAQHCQGWTASAAPRPAGRGARTSA